MKAILREEVKKICEYHIELLVQSVYKTRATIITERELRDEVLKNLYNSCIYEPMRVKAI